MEDQSNMGDCGQILILSEQSVDEPMYVLSNRTQFLINYKNNLEIWKPISVQLKKY